MALGRSGSQATTRASPDSGDAGRTDAGYAGATKHRLTHLQGGLHSRTFGKGAPVLLRLMGSAALACCCLTGRAPTSAPWTVGHTCEEVRAAIRLTAATATP